MLLLARLRVATEIEFRRLRFIEVDSVFEDTNGSAALEMVWSDVIVFLRPVTFARRERVGKEAFCTSNDSLTTFGFWIGP